MVRTLLRRIGDRIRRFAGGKKKEPAKSAPHPHKTAPATSARGQAAARPPKPVEHPAHRRSRHGHTSQSVTMPAGAKSSPHRPPAPPAPTWSLAGFVVPPREGAVRFHDLGLPDEVMHAVADLGFQYGTPIQAAILPKTLAGADAAGSAQTGTGKTAAFLITIFTHRLRHPPAPGRRSGSPRALILAPTRELCLQIHKEAEEIGRHTPFRAMAVFGGMDYDRQRRELQGRPVDVVVATPGRLLDFQRKRALHLDKVEILVIDEADRMLDMGFIPDVRTIVHSTPPKDRRQTMLFSATLTPEVTRLCAQWTRDPAIVEIEPTHVAAESVEQIVYITTTAEKFMLLFNILKKHPDRPMLVFANRRDQTRDLVDKLRAYGITCALLSGEVPQEKRVRTLDDFKSGRLRVLVATDVAGRGLHVEDISHVINFNLPQEPEDYVHRIGRTGRAGATGISVSFACEEDGFYIPDIEKYIGNPLKCIHPEPDLLVPPPPPEHPYEPRRRRGPPSHGHGGGYGGGRGRRPPRRR